MIYTNKPYTNILKGSVTDAKLKYFNMKDYFDKILKWERYILVQNSLYHNFNPRNFFNEIRSKKNVSQLNYS